jgi:hypothetical protein
VLDLIEPRKLLLPFEYEHRLPEVGRAVPAVRISRPTTLRPNMLRKVRRIYARAPFRCATDLPDIRDLSLSGEAHVDERTASGTSQRLELDSEADAFCAVMESRADAERLAHMIASLVTRART